jgi:phospholipid/cholesterol/gamma-HCH transport system substrate-binding protein
MSAREEAGPATVARALAVAAVLLVAVVVAILLFAGDGGYRVTADFVNAGQLVKGSEVRVAGAAVGTVDKIDVSHDGLAEVTISVNDD